MATAAGRSEWSIGTVAAGVLFAALVLGVPWYLHRTQAPLPADTRQPAHLLGKPLRLQTAGGERILVLSEQYGVHWSWSSGPSRHSFSRPVQQQVIDVDLWAFEPGNATPLWRRRFRNNTPGPMTAVGDMLLGHGDRVWLALAEPVLVAADDGRLLRPSQRIGEPARGDEVYDVRDLQARGQRIGDRWTGVLTAAEAQRLAGPDGGDWRPDALGHAGDEHDYRMWSARVRDGSADFGRVERYDDFRPLGEPVDRHRAGLLRATPGAAPITLPAPDSVLVLHRAAEADGARLSLTRIAVESGDELWTAADLPIARLRHLLPGAGDLVLVGDGPRPPPASAEAEPPAPAQWLVFVDLADGRRESFDLAAASLAAEPVPLQATGE